MAKLTRKKQEIFAVDAPLNRMTVYGTAKDGASAIYSQDVGVLQGGLWKQGIEPSLLGNFAPFVEDDTGYRRVLTEQLAYIFQNGMPEWDAKTNYYKDVSFCQVGGQWYQSLIGTDLQPNIGNNPVGDIINWKKASFGGGAGYALLQGVAFNMELTGDDAKGWALSGSMVSGQNGAEGLPVLAQAYGTGEDYIKTVPWTQPIATANTFPDPSGLGNVEISSSSAHITYNTWKALDGVKSGSNMETGWGIDNITSFPQWWKVKFPYKICITGLKGYKRTEVNLVNANATGRFYTNSTKTIPIGNEYTNNGGNWNAVSITSIPPEGIITDTIYFEQTGGGIYSGIGELEITATRVFNSNYAGITGIKQASAVKKGLLIAPYTEANKAALDTLWNAGKEANVWLLDESGARFMCPRTHNWTANTTGVNDFIPESLPNINGYLSGVAGIEATGAITTIPADKLTGGSASRAREGSFNFNASLSSPAYKDAASVQQNASTVYVYYKIYDAIKPSADIVVNDLTQILTDMQALENGKANVALDNISSNIDYVVENWKSEDGLSWYRKYKSGWVEQGGTTPPGSSYTNFMILFANTNYFVSSELIDPFSGTGHSVIQSLSINGFTHKEGQSGTSTRNLTSWAKWIAIGKGV